jgi:Spy/CpxP family protein refolding chaperone
LGVLIVLSSKWKVAALLAGLMLAPALSHGQGPGGGRGRGGFGGGFGRGGSSISSLLRMEEVQKEISVTDEQKAALEKAAEERRAQREQGGGFNFQELQNLSEEERAKRMAEFQKTMEEATKKADEQVKALLKPEQVARLNQLRVQQEGLGALNREDVQKELGLSEEQVGKIKAATEARNARPTGGPPNFQDASEEELRKMREEREARVKKYEEEMKAVLTADQTAAFEKMQGAKFTFPAGGGFGGPGGGRGGRGGPGGGGRPRPE